MAWTEWLIGSAVLFFTGAYFVRAGKTKIVGLYIIACVLLLLMSMTNFGLVFGSNFVSWAKTILGILAPVTFILAIWNVQRDRETVMGPPGDRETITTAAVVYSADVAGDSLDGGGGGAEG